MLRLLHEPRELRPGMTWRLIYQDLKPANLLLAAHDRVTVLDLGGCQLTNLATGQKLLQGACTPAYCPPECERPYAHLTPAADVYTVGSTLFHLLTGRSPLEFLPAGLALNQARAVHARHQFASRRVPAAARELILQRLPCRRPGRAVCRHDGTRASAGRALRFMKLHVGERLPGSGPPGQPGGYLVTEVLRETPWSNLYAARKILYNFDFASQRWRESDDGEWLDVLLRTCSFDDLRNPHDAERRRAAARVEVRHVLAHRASNVWPEPLDMLDGDDPGSHGNEEEDRDSEPIIVLARLHGDTLRGWLARRPALPKRLALVAELLSFVEAAHRDGLVLNCLGPEAFVVDSAGRLGYLASDCVVPKAEGERTWQYAALFPPERYPAGFSPPECFEATLLAAISAQTCCLVGGSLVRGLYRPEDHQRLAEAQGEPWFCLQPAHTARLQEILGQLSASELWALASTFTVDAAAFVAAWPHNLVRVLQRGLDLEPHWRPGTVDRGSPLAGHHTAAACASLAARLDAANAEHRQLRIY